MAGFLFSAIIAAIEISEIINIRLLIQVNVVDLYRKFYIFKEKLK
jgi:hypothetical protein